MASFDDLTLRDLHRAAQLADRPGISVPSIDLYDGDRDPREVTSARQSVSRLVASGRVIKVRRDLVVLPDATGLTRVSVPELVDAVAPRPYLITGLRALQHHDLTDQHAFTVIALTPKRISGFAYRGEKAVFMLTSVDRIWGAVDERGPMFATPERAIIDAVSSARYGVSIPQAASALRLAAARDDRLIARLLASVERYGKDATSRRIGLLVQRHLGEQAAAPFRRLLAPTRKSHVLLRPNGPTDGILDPSWGVVVNVSPGEDEHEHG